MQQIVADRFFEPRVVSPGIPKENIESVITEVVLIEVVMLSESCANYLRTATI